MKLHPQAPATLSTITGYGPGWIEINAVRVTGAILVQPEAPVQSWPVSSFEALVATDFEAILACSPDVVLLGSGTRQRFVHPRLLASLSTRRIGLECMDTAAACRTYNILMTEGRKVLAALLPMD
jgi:uncharacterized protein